MAYYPPGYGAPGIGHRHPIAAGAAIAAASERRYFVIIAEWNGQALDIRGNNRNPGAEILSYQRKVGHHPNQMWYCDHSGIIRSALNDFALDASLLQTFRMMPFTGQNDQQWIFAGNRIVNRLRPMECLTDREGNRPCHCKNYKGKSRQHWRVEMC